MFAAAMASTLDRFLRRFPSELGWAPGRTTGPLLVGFERPSAEEEGGWEGGFGVP